MLSLVLANSSEEEYNRKHSLAHLYKGVTLYGAEDSYVLYAVDTLVSSVAPPPLRRLDQTEPHFSPAGGADRPGP